jgi:molecular chaperone HscB
MAEKLYKPTAVSVEKQAEQAHQCWSCGDMRAAHFCDSCGRVQPPQPADFFSFFGLPHKLNIDDANLQREFYALSRKLHPDVFVRASQLEQNWSLEKSSQLNDAYRTLRDPVSRTEYLLRKEGVQLDEQSKLATEKARSAGTPKRQLVPPDMLEEVFELNLQLEEARAQRQGGELDATLLEQLRETRRHLDEKYKVLMSELKECWDEWDAMIDRGGQDEDRNIMLGRMLDVLNRRSYLRNLVRDVNEVLEG